MLKNILWGMLNICDLHLIKSQSVYVDLSMPEDKKRAQQKYKTMEGNYLTAGDLALIENRRGYGYGDGYGHYGCYGHGKGMAATGIGLADGLGGGALSGGHYDEEFARHDISKMLPRGEYWSLKQVEDATKGMSFPQALPLVTNGWRSMPLQMTSMGCYPMRTSSRLRMPFGLPTRIG